MLFVSSAQREADPDPWAQERLPAYFTLLAAAEQVVDADAFERLLSRKEHQVKAACLDKCPHCRDVRNVRTMLTRTPVRLMPMGQERR